MADWTTQAPWIDRLNTLLDNKADIEDSADVAIGSFNVNQDPAYKRVLAGIAECRLMIAKLADSGVGIPKYVNNREAGTADTTTI